ncbi:hypothetical protein ACHAWF_003051 [Thalassiosira exigua]
MNHFGRAAAVARGVEGCASSYLPKACGIKGGDSRASHYFSSGSGDGCLSGGGDDDNHFGVWPPNQTTVIFQQMEKECPDALKAYARCVIEKQNGGVLVQGACKEKFQAVMNCFRSVRKS